VLWKKKFSSCSQARTGFALICISLSNWQEELVWLFTHDEAWIGSLRTAPVIVISHAIAGCIGEYGLDADIRKALLMNQSNCTRKLKLLRTHLKSSEPAMGRPMGSFNANVDGGKSEWNMFPLFH